MVNRRTAFPDLGGTALPDPGRTTLPDPGIFSGCICADREALFAIDGEEFRGQFDGSISVSVGQTTLDGQGLATIPLNIVGYTTTSKVKGLGRVTLDFDFERSVAPSTLKGSNAKTFFPATQTMYLNILMTTDALPGVTLRSRTRGALVNDEASSFPPKPGSVYRLQRPLALEDVKRPGKTKVTLLSVNTEIVSAQTSPTEIRTNAGVTVYAASDDGFALKELGRKTSIRFKLAEGGKLKVTVFDARGHEALVVAEGKWPKGKHTLIFDGSELRGKEYSYQIQLDGVKRTGKLPLLRR